MKIRTAFCLLLLFSYVSAWAQAESPSVAPPADQAEESVDSSSTTDTSATSTVPSPSVPEEQPLPGWIHLVRLAAVAGPVAFLLLAWAIGAVVHFSLVRREQQQFPVIRGSRTPQTVPMVISGVLFLVLAIVFAIFEWKSRDEISRGVGGVVDQWHPVTSQAVITLIVCLVLAVLPWLFARRANTVA